MDQSCNVSFGEASTVWYCQEGAASFRSATVDAERSASKRLSMRSRTYSNMNWDDPTMDWEEKLGRHRKGSVIG